MKIIDNHNQLTAYRSSISSSGCYVHVTRKEIYFLNFLTKKKYLIHIG